jgi:hypothetical protein
MPPAIAKENTQMRLLQPAAALIATAITLAATALPAAALPHRGTMADLGFDAGGGPYTAAAVSATLAAMEPETGSIILTSCAHYLATAESARSQDTMDFCSVALRDASRGTIRTFGSVQPYPLQIVPPPIPPSPPSTSTSECQFPHYTVDPTDPCY